MKERDVAEKKEKPWAREGPFISLKEMVASLRNIALSFLSEGKERKLEAIGQRPDNSLLREYVNGFQLPRAMFPGLEAGGSHGPFGPPIFWGSLFLCEKR